MNRPLNKIILLLSVFIVITFSCNNDKGNAKSTHAALYFPPSGTTEWETKTPESLGWEITEIPGLLTLLEDNDTRAFIVLKDGYIVIEEYFGNNLLDTAPFDMSKMWYWASAGKTLTTFVIGKAVEDGYLSINDRTSDYLGTGWTSLSAAQENAITVRHQLTMTTGLDDEVANSHSILPEDLIYKADSGTRWAYHNGPYTLLEHVFEDASGLNFSDYFTSSLRDKIGMDGFWYWNGEDNVYYSTPRSMARFGLLILNNGVWQDDALISHSEFFDDMLNTSQSLNLSYGYLWWLNGKESFMVPQSQIVFSGNFVPNAPDDMVCGMGRNGQYLSIVPSENIVLIRMGEEPTGVPVPFLFLDDIWEKFALVIQ